MLAGALVALASACASQHVDAQRLATLQHDPLVVVAAPGTSSLNHADSAGTGNGIGFGGTSPTVVSRALRLHGSRTAVARFYAQTAIRNGWRVSTVRCSAKTDLISASKQFPGWIATATIGVGDHYELGPAVTIFIETPWHGERTQSVLNPHAFRPLTLSGVARTCLGGGS